MRTAFAIYDLDKIDQRLSDIVIEYEESAPVVSRWADGLYRTVHGFDEQREGGKVTLDELSTAQSMYEDGNWATPHVAQNRVYKLFERMGWDTAGMLDF